MPINACGAIIASAWTLSATFVCYTGHSRRFRFVRFRWHCGHEFLRQGRDGPTSDISLLIRSRLRRWRAKEACAQGSAFFRLIANSYWSAFALRHQTQFIVAKLSTRGKLLTLMTPMPG